MSECELTYVARVLARIATDDPPLYRRIVGPGRQDHRKSLAPTGGNKADFNTLLQSATARV